MYSTVNFNKILEEANNCKDHIDAYKKGEKRIKIETLIELREKLNLSSKNLTTIDNMINELKR